MHTYYLFALPNHSKMPSIFGRLLLFLTCVLLHAEGNKQTFLNFVQRILPRTVQSLESEFTKLNELPLPKPSDAFKKNMELNRYSDVFCEEGTRVHLDNGRYIHANWVHSEFMGGRRIIATQSPKPNTVDDFWHMVAQYRVEVIIMLCGMEELGTNGKCYKYWPDHQTKGTTVRYLSGKKLRDGQFETSLEVVLAKGDTLPVQHIHVRDWPDRGVPSDVENLFRLFPLIAKHKRVVVHCSAGIGRTGTFVALDLAGEQLKAGRQLDVEKLVKQLRGMRAQSVQTPKQYLFIYSALLRYSLFKQPILKTLLNYRSISKKIREINHRIQKL